MPAIVVVGAGPAGCTAALSAARLPNAHVKILEKRSLASLVGSSSSPRAYPMVLSGRALKALEGLDLDLPSLREPYHGITLMPSGAEMRFSDPGRNRLVSRTEVSLNLLREVAQHDNITVHFSASPSSIDFARQHVRVEDIDAVMYDFSAEVLTQLPPAMEPDSAESRGSGALPAGISAQEEGAVSAGHAQPVEMNVSTTAASAWTTALAVHAKGWPGSDAPGDLPYDLLVAADGANSQVRRLAEAEALIKAETVFRSKNAYKTFTDVSIPAVADAAACPFAAPDLQPCQNLFFIPSQASDCEMKLVLWRSDSSHLCGMVPNVNGDRPESQALLERAFGSVIPTWLLQQLQEQLASQPPSPFGSVVMCSALHTTGSVVLLGDSAHSVTSSLGQGCNMALESVGIFHALLANEVANGVMPLAEAPAAFTARRRRDVHAMQRMEELSNVAQGSAAARSPVDAVHARVAFGSAIILGTLQWKLLPQYETLPLYRMLYDEDTPYGDTLDYVNRTAAGMYIVLSAALASACINFVELEVEVFPAL